MPKRLYNYLKKNIKNEYSRLEKIRDNLIKEITKIDQTYLTGHPKLRLPNHASFIFSHIEGESILLNMDICSTINRFKT